MQNKKKENKKQGMRGPQMCFFGAKLCLG